MKASGAGNDEMDQKTIYSKTGKGVLEIKNKGGKLSKDLTRILVLDKRHDWTLKGEVNVNAWVRPSRDLRKELPEVQEFHFTSASVVFPLLRGSSSHKMYDTELSSELRFDQTLMADKPGEMLETFPCGTRLGRGLKRPSTRLRRKSVRRRNPSSGRKLGCTSSRSTCRPYRSAL